MNRKSNQWNQLLLTIAEKWPTLTPFQVVVFGVLSQGWIPDSLTRQRIQRTLEIDQNFQFTANILSVSSKIRPNLTKLNEIQILNDRNFLDVSTTSQQGVLTGIQRIVSSINLESNILQRAVITRSGILIFEHEHSMGKFVKLLNLSGAGIWHKWISPKILKLGNEKMQKFSIKIVTTMREILNFGCEGQKKSNVYIPMNSFWNLLEVPSNRSQIELLEFLCYSDLIQLRILIHDLIPLTHPELCPPDPRGNFLRFLKLTNCASEIICVSEYVKDRYESYLTTLDSSQFTPKIRKLPYPVSPLVRKKGSTSLQIEEFLALNKKYLLAIGGFTARKNLGIVIGALALAQISMNLVIVGNNQWGDKYLEEELKIWSVIKDQIHLFPNISDVDLSALLDNADALVYPSLAEGFGLPILEGTAYGLPVLTSNLEPMKSLTEELIAIDPNSLKEWANAINCLVNNHKSRSRTIDIDYNIQHDISPNSPWGIWTNQFFGIDTHG